MRFLAFLTLAVAFSPLIAQAAEPTTKPTVLLLRFAKMNEATNNDWVARVIQESLLTDSAKLKTVHVIVNQQSITTDIPTARQFARDARADIVVVGGYQSIADNLKITAQVVQVDSGEIIGTLKSTGALSDCLSMEDTLGRQLTKSLPPSQASAARNQPIVEIESLGPIRNPDYTRTFAPPNPNLHQAELERYLYRTPAFYPYCYYGGGYSCFHGCGYSGSWNPVSSIFYGD